MRMKTAIGENPVDIVTADTCLIISIHGRPVVYLYDYTIKFSGSQVTMVGYTKEGDEYTGEEEEMFNHTFRKEIFVFVPLA